MKVLLDHPFPFALAHGGLQSQIEQTKAALEACGLGVEYVRWWDESQTGDIIHFFGRPFGHYVQIAQQKGRRFVMAELLGGLGARGPAARTVQRGIIGLARTLLPRDFCARMAWDSYQKADACIALTPWEAHLMQTMFSAPPGRVHVISNGVEPAFLQGSSGPRGPWLVCTATITEVKRVLELAEAALAARTPVWVIGRPYSEQQDYPRRFQELARQNPQWVRYDGPVQDRAALAQIYREARGFVLLSRWETLSLSALEAAACGCPLLLSDLPWARSVFGEHARYCSRSAGVRETAHHLREFYDQAPQLPPPPKPKSWAEVGQSLAAVYRSLVDRP